MVAAMDLQLALMLLPGLVIGLTVHEFAHAWSASLLGDDFPRRKKRVSLNPLRHLSPLGTLAIFVLPFGWGRPVEVNLYNFRRPKRDYLLTSLAGPLANIVVAGVATLIMQLTRHSFILPGPKSTAVMGAIHLGLKLVVVINVVLAVINLIPIPPLDGSKIWPCLFPGAKPGVGRRLTWLFVGLLLTLMWAGVLDKVISMPVAAISSVLPVSDVSRVRTLDRQIGEAMEAEDYELLERLADERLAIHESHVGCSARAIAREGQGDLLGALDSIDRAIALSPERAGNYAYRAKLYDLLGQPENAAKDWETVRQLEAASDRQGE